MYKLASLTMTQLPNMTYSRCCCCPVGGILPQFYSASRGYHTCGLIHSTANGREVVVAGGYPAESRSATEILNLATLTWRAGPEVPGDLNGLVALVALPVVPVSHLFRNSLVVRAAAAQMGSTFAAVGALLGSARGEVYLFDEVNYEWNLMEQANTSYFCRISLHSKVLSGPRDSEGTPPHRPAPGGPVPLVHTYYT